MDIIYRWNREHIVRSSFLLLVSTCRAVKNWDEKSLYSSLVNFKCCCCMLCWTRISNEERTERTKKKWIISYELLEASHSMVCCREHNPTLSTRNNDKNFSGQVKLIAWNWCLLARLNSLLSSHCSVLVTIVIAFCACCFIEFVLSTLSLVFWFSFYIVGKKINSKKCLIPQSFHFYFTKTQNDDDVDFIFFDDTNVGNGEDKSWQIER